MIPLDLNTFFNCPVPNADFYLNPDNYPVLNNHPLYPPEIKPWLEIPHLEESECNRLTKFIDPPAHFHIDWCATLFRKGNSLPPHLDVEGVLHNEVYARIIIWVTPPEFEGREFVWGSIKDPIPGVLGYGWNHPNLTEVGRIKPRTGLGYILDIQNPNIYHGVTELTSETPVASILGSVIYRK